MTTVTPLLQAPLQGAALTDTAPDLADSVTPENALNTATAAVQSSLDAAVQAVAELEERIAELTRQLAERRQEIPRLENALAVLTGAGAAVTETVSFEDAPNTVWLDLLGNNSLGFDDIFKSACARFSVSPQSPHAAKLRARVRSGITSLTRSGGLLASGTGRGKRYRAALPATA